MSTLQAFLNKNPIDENMTEEVVISERFKDKDKIFKFKIRALTENEMEEINKACMRYGKKGKVEFETNKYNRLIAVKGTVDPSFTDADSIAKLSCTTPSDYIRKVLLPGEIAALADEIQRLSGYTDLEELKEEAKN